MISLHEKILVLAKRAHDITQRLQRQVSNDRGLVKILLKGAVQLPQRSSMRGAQAIRSQWHRAQELSGLCSGVDEARKKLKLSAKTVNGFRGPVTDPVFQFRRESAIGQLEKVQYLMSAALSATAAQTKNPKQLKRRTR